MNTGKTVYFLNNIYLHNRRQRYTLFELFAILLHSHLPKVMNFLLSMYFIGKKKEATIQKRKKPKIGISPEVYKKDKSFKRLDPVLRANHGHIVNRRNTVKTFKRRKNKY